MLKQELYLTYAAKIKAKIKLHNQKIAIEILGAVLFLRV